VRRWLRLTALAGAVIAVAAAGWAGSSALAANDVGNPVLADCNSNGVLTHNYTLAQLRHALAIMPASYKEYGNCQDAIQAAIIKVKAGKQIAPDSGSGGSFLPTPVIVILVVLILAGVTFGALAVRRRGGGPGGPGDGPGDGDPPRGTSSPPTPPPSPPAAE
jgi:hypothetical protein